MKKDKSSAMRTLFQMAAMALAVITGENQVSAERSAGIAYDNFRSGLTLHNLREIFRSRVSFAQRTRSSKRRPARRPEQAPKASTTRKGGASKFKRYTARRDV
ncbi:MAG: hypothetical protein K8R48_03155 [Alphaproteobacteria bacterium]|nr:hypothetical protein [Alphaproteobacteria bacterium]